MTRKEIERYYKVCNSRIASPGKFECEMLYVPYFWNLYLNGLASDEGKYIHFRVSKEDRKEFPELKGRQRIKLAVTENGFVVEV